MITPYSNIISVTTLMDSDAQAFFDRVTTAGGSLSTTEKTAVNTLVLQMKADGIWSSMKAIYPMVGASAAACAQNLKSSSFTGTFTSGWTFASTGVKGNGTSAYMNTGFNTSTNSNYLNFSLSIYLRTTEMGTGYMTDMGNSVSPGFLPLTHLESNVTNRIQYCWDYTAGRGLADISTTNPSGMWGLSRTAISTWVSFERNSSVSKTTTTTQSSLPNNNVYIGATNYHTSGATGFSEREINFAHLGDGLTSTEFDDFYTAVQAFQTTLSRNV